MALTVSPTFPPPPNSAPYAIGREWCMGDSLGVLNANFNYFDTTTQILSSSITSLRQSTPQVQLFVNSSTSSSTWRGTPVVAGNDSTATGTASLPFKTLPACLDYLYKNLDVRGRLVTICLCAGTYEGAIISGMPPGSGYISRPVAPTLDYCNIKIVGDSQATTFITQIQMLNDRWGVFFITSANYTITDVTFRYNPGNPIAATAGPGTGFNTWMDVIWTTWNSVVVLVNCTFEAFPMLLTTSNPQQTLTRYVVVDTYSHLIMSNITINNFLNGTGATSVMGRYFLQMYRSHTYLEKTFTLQNGPRFSVFAEPAWAAHYTHADDFVWAGNFGTQLGNVGGERTFNGNFNYLPNYARNYLIKQDGPKIITWLKWQMPGNSHYAALPVSYDQAVGNWIGGR